MPLREKIEMSTTNWNGRWFHLRKVLERGGPLAHPDFQASNETLDFLLDNCKVNTYRKKTNILI